MPKPPAKPPAEPHPLGELCALIVKACRKATKPKGPGKA